MRINSRREMNEKINDLKFTLDSVTKQKINAEKEVGKLRLTASSLCDKLSTTGTELEFLLIKLEESKSQIAEARNQLAMVEICTASERSKVSSHIAHLNVHREGFTQLFDKERALLEIRDKELREKEAEELESEKQRQKMAAARAEAVAREADAVGAEAAALEQACAVLRKRNNAIMLKLRRKLVEAEDARRDLLKLKDGGVKSA